MSLPKLDPYSSLPNTRPRISSPLVSELTFTHPHDRLSPLNHPPPPPTYSTNTRLLIFLFDSLLFIRLAQFLLPHLSLHLHSLLTLAPIPPPQELVQTLSFIPPHIIIPALALIKSISGLCLLNTGTTWTSYSARSALVCTTLAGLLLVPNPPPLLSISILLISLLTGVVVICLPLLRFIQILVDLEDQQSIQNRHQKPGHPFYPLRKSAHVSRNSNLLQSRYQHLMNPF